MVDYHPTLPNWQAILSRIRLAPIRTGIVLLVILFIGVGSPLTCLLQAQAHIDLVPKSVPLEQVATSLPAQPIKLAETNPPFATKYAVTVQPSTANQSDCFVCRKHEASSLNSESVLPLPKLITFSLVVSFLLGAGTPFFQSIFYPPPRIPPRLSAV